MKLNNKSYITSAAASNDLLAIDIRQASHHLWEITGQITIDDLLDKISQSSVLVNSFCEIIVFWL